MQITPFVDADLVFDEAKHIYLYKGKRAASVTQVLKAGGLSKGYGDVDPKVLANAAARGTAVHTAIERYHDGTLNWDDLHEDIVPRVVAYDKFVSDHSYTHICSEQKYFSPTWGYAGGMDAVGLLPRWNGVTGPHLVLLDYKTSYEKDPASWRIQVQAYKNLWNENNPNHPIDHCIILWLNRFGEYELIDADDKESWALFVYAVRILNWKRRNGRLK